MSGLSITPELVRRALKKLVGRKLAQEYQRDPIKWYIERFGGRLEDIDWDAWGSEYKEHEWDGTPNPFLLAWRTLAAWKSVGIESATSTGKTFIAARIVYWFLDAFPDSLVVTTAPKQQQLKSVLWAEISACFKRFKKIRPKADMFSLRILPDGSKVRFGKSYKEAEDEDLSDLHIAIGVVAGVRADEESATKMQGYHRKYMLFIVEECAGVPDPVMTAIKNTCTGDYNIILGIGNPDNAVDALHQFCELNHVEAIRISAYDHPNVVLKRTVIDGAVTQKSIDIRRDEYGEKSNMFLSRVRGIAPMQSIDSLIMYEWIIAIMEGRPEYTPVPDDPWSMNALGMDVANSFNGDAACLAWGLSNHLKQLHEFQCPNANHLAHNVVKSTDELKLGNYRDYGTSKIDEYKINPYYIGVDAVGVGIGAVNEFTDTMGLQIRALQGGPDLECIPTDAQGKPLYNFRSMRAQMLYQLRLDTQRRDYSMHISDKRMQAQVIRELTTPRYKVSDSVIMIEKKEEIKARLAGKSPNVLDAIAYWNWVRKDRRVRGRTAPMTSISQNQPQPLNAPVKMWNEELPGDRPPLPKGFE